MNHSIDSSSQTEVHFTGTPRKQEATEGLGTPRYFQLLEELGRGGMGQVYRAFDVRLQREVAVKILHERFDANSSIAARFLQEAQITGQLQHPGIPAVYEVSTLGDGRPFLAMKLIRGETLEQLLLANKPINRLAIFETVAQAIGYAHAHRVIHRDLKPANIMVGAFGEVQVMDWGLARRLEREDGSEAATLAEAALPLQPSVLTQAGSVLGTPAYMAPEQARGEIDRVDQRSDVFGLGAVLCVMLTGRPPFSGSTVENIRCNAANGRLSEALARLDTCGADPALIDLCKRCLSVDPESRPVDGNAVAQVVAGLRVAAEERAKRAEINRIRAEVIAREQVRRRRILQWAVVIVVMVLTWGIVGTSIGMRQANLARQAALLAEKEANDKRLEAEKQTVLANSVKAFLQHDVLQLADPKTQHQAQKTGLKYDADVRLRDVVLRAAEQIEGKFVDQPLVEAEIRGTLGVALLGMGRADLADKQLERAFQLNRQYLGEAHSSTLWNLTNLALNKDELGQHREAKRLNEELLVLRQLHFGDDHQDTVWSKNNLALSLAALGLHRQAVQLRQQVLAWHREKLGADHPNTLTSMNNLALSYEALGQSAEALVLRQTCLEIQKQKLGIDHPDTLKSANNLALSFLAMSRHTDSIKLLEQTVPLMKEKLGRYHSITLAGMANLAVAYHATKRFADALPLLQETFDLMRQTLGPNHPNTLKTMMNLAMVYGAIGRLDDELKLEEETLRLQTKHLGPEHPDTLLTLTNLASTLTQLGRQPEALQRREQALPQLKKAYGPEHSLTIRTMQSLVKDYLRLQCYQEACPLLQELITAQKKTLGVTNSATLRSMDQLAQTLDKLGRPTEALPVREESYAQRTKSLGGSDPSTLQAGLELVQAWRKSGKPDQALTLLDELLRQADPPNSSQKQVSSTLLANLYRERIDLYRSKKDVAGCRAMSENWESRKLRDALSLYNAACFRAITAAVQADTPGENSARLSREEADRAVSLLKQALTAGFRHRALLEINRELDYLRDRDDFLQLISSLPKKN